MPPTGSLIPSDATEKHTQEWTMAFSDVQPPAEGGTISIRDGVLQVPDDPVLPFIRGDGTGPDIWHASQLVFDAAVEKAYGGRRRIGWFEAFAGGEAFERFESWLPA